LKDFTLNKKVTIINQDSGYLMIDIANAFADAGHEVSLITGRLMERSTKLNPGVKLSRIIRYQRSKPFKRIFTWSWGFLQIVFKVVFSHRKSHLFIVTNPPLAPFLPLLVKNPFSLLIFDIYPDALWQNAKASQKAFWVKAWQKANRKVFGKAERVFTLTDSMRQALSRYVSAEKVEVVPIWTDSHFLKPIPPAENPFIKKHGLQGRFIVLYSGNLGFTHKVEVLPDLAAKVNDPRVVFLIIGDGDRKAQLEKKIRKIGLKNCLLLPWQPVEVLPYSLASASLAVVSSGSGAAQLSIPSKAFNFMSVGAPLLCLSPKGSELEKLVIRHNNGQCFPHEQLDDIAAYILSLLDNEAFRMELSGNSLKAAGEYTPENARRFMMKKPVKEQQKQHLIDIMQADEASGLYDA
jgi:glycosyltransferase involved in cell wall biosynthesis